MSKKNRKPVSRGDKAFDIGIYIIMILIMFIILYPLYFVVIASFSDPIAVMSGKVIWTPVSFGTESYRLVFKDSRVLYGYRNTLLYTCAGTAVNMIMSVCAAYPLSRRNLKGKGFGLGMMVFTMFFSGGMIPTYITIQNLGLLDTFNDYVNHNPDGLINEEVISSYVCWGGAGNPTFYEDKTFGNNFYTAMETEVVAKRMENAISEVWGDFNYTTEEYAELAILESDIQTYVKDMRAKFISGEVELNDDNWNAYISTLEKMDLAGLMAIYQNGLDRYNAAK